MGLPAASICWAPAGTLTFVLTASTLPLRTRMVAFSMAGLPVPSMTRAPTNALSWAKVKVPPIKKSAASWSLPDGLLDALFDINGNPFHSMVERILFGVHLRRIQTELASLPLPLIVQVNHDVVQLVLVVDALFVGAETD